ncbi:MAG: pentapeptide repeat-containing protein [Methanothrix sp.]|nr:pentapeptide repeat-containing protein [Methanothrix sp.]
MAKKSKPGQGLKVEKPKSVFERSFQVDYKGLFKSLSKGVIHVAGGKLEEASIDATETLSSLGLKTEDPGELAFLLINRSMTEALLELVRECSSQQLIDEKKDPDAILEQFDFSSSASEVFIDRKFLDRPADMPFLKDVQSLLQKWLEELYLSKPSAKPSAKAIADRLPSYFVYALNQEWRKNAKTYRPIIEALDTPFAKAGDREWAWSAYSALLQHRINEVIFDEPFSLRQMYVPLNAFYLEDESKGKEQSEEMARIGRKRRRVVVSLGKEIEQWLDNPSSQDAIRVISGGPGSGKSSFARIFAAKHSHDLELKVLYIPLHLIDATKGLVEEIGRFVRDEGVLLQNPLDSESPEPNLLIIFDGLDELASQGKAAAETARAFIREVDRTVEKRNQQGVKLRILISGRELVVQENESEFRRQRQILTLLPYFINKPYDYEGRLVLDGVECRDPEELLERDLRQQWWKKYGSLTGRSYKGLPAELGREDLAEVTAQPLLNYLVALSFTREKLDFTKDINLNLIYADLVAGVHERGYDTHRYIHIRHMNLEDFFRVLEEIGLASWHGDGRSTTVREIKEHCNASGLGSMLEKFQEGAEEGVTRLLAAFFFRKFGQRSSGDSTFVFTHKSFGEYLTARRIVRAVDRVIRELERRAKSPDEGWDEKDALKHWAQICGPSAITPYLHDFFLNEMKLKTSEELTQWQSRLARLFSYVLRHGMPMEQLGIVPFERAIFQSRNAEEALLVALNSCARFTKQLSLIEHIEKLAFGAWFRRIQGQRVGNESALAARCLSFLNLSENILYISDFLNADFSFTNLFGLKASLACFSGANLRGSCLVGAYLDRANLDRANLDRANLEGADLDRANLRGANLDGANLRGADLEGANLRGANLRGADLEGADLSGADLEGANLSDANLSEANLREANLKRANLRGADLEGANLKRANLRGADLEGADLKRATLGEADFGGAELRGAKLPADFRFLIETAKGYGQAR